MHRYLVFDLDGTLAPPGKKCPTEAVNLLSELETAGYTVVLCSGKPIYYLCGFARQLGLSEPILIGETGAEIAFGVELPFKKMYALPISPDAPRQIAILKKEIDLACQDAVWYQPNSVALTPFFKNQTAKGKIENILNRHPEMEKTLNVYPQFDCFDILPKEVNKEAGLRYLSRLLSASSSDFLVAGDGINDVSMFRFADISVAVGKNEEVRRQAKLCFDCITDALIYIKDNHL